MAPNNPKRFHRGLDLSLARALVTALVAAVLVLVPLTVVGHAAPGDRFRQDPHLPATVTSIERVLAGPGDVALQLRGRARPGSVVKVYDNAVCHSDLLPTGGTSIETVASESGIWTIEADIPALDRTQVPPRWISVRSHVVSGALSRCRLVELPDAARVPIFAPGTAVIGGIDLVAPQGDGRTKVVGWIADLSGTPRRAVDITDSGTIVPVPPTVLKRAQLHRSPQMSRVLPKAWIRGFVAFVDRSGIGHPGRFCAQTRVGGFANQFACQDGRRVGGLGLTDLPNLGRITSVTRIGDKVRVAGWAAHSFSKQATPAYFAANGRPVGTAQADRPRPGLARFLPGMGNAHGFEFTFTAGPGRQRVCMFPLLVGGLRFAALDCRLLPAAN